MHEFEILREIYNSNWTPLKQKNKIEKANECYKKNIWILSSRARTYQSDYFVLVQEKTHVFISTLCPASDTLNIPAPPHVHTYTRLDAEPLYIMETLFAYICVRQLGTREYKKLFPYILAYTFFGCFKSSVIAEDTSAPIKIEPDCLCGCAFSLYTTFSSFYFFFPNIFSIFSTSINLLHRLCHIYMYIMCGK